MLNASRYLGIVCVAALVALFAGCGQDHKDAAALGRALTNARPVFVEAGAMEQDLVKSTRTWVDSIITNGAGKASELPQRAAIAKQLAQSADAVSTRLGTVHKAAYDVPLQSEDVQAVRTTLNAQITKRQKLMQNVRTALESASTGFLELSQSRSYKGDTYPGGIDTLNHLLDNYSIADGALNEAVTTLKTKYKLESSEVGG